MPQIVEYTNTQNIQPTDRGTESRVQEGRRIGASFNQVAESTRDFANRTGQQIGSAIRDAGNVAVDYATHREIGQGVASYALMQDTLTNQWNDIAKNADPNDPTVRQRFIEGKLTPALQEWGDTFATEGGQKWAQNRTASLLDHMYEKTAADMGTLAAQAVTNNLRTVGNTMSNTAMNDPSSVPHLLDGVDSSVGAVVDSSPNLKGAAAGRAKTEISEKQKEAVVKAGAIGAIQKSTDPEATADDWTRRYPQYISGEEARILAANARSQIRARDYDERTNNARLKQEQAERSNEATSQYLIDISSKNPKLSGDPTAQKILNDQNLTKSDKRNLLNYIDRELKPETDNRISQQTFIGLLRDLRQPNVDANALAQKAWDARLTDAGKPGSMTQPDFDRFRKELEDRKTPEGLALQQDRDHFFKRYAVVLDPAQAAGLESPAGSEARYRAEMDARRQEQALRTNGQDPHSLYDPGSQNFMGRPERLQQYQTSMQDAAKSRADAMKGGNKPSPLPNDKPARNFNEMFGPFDSAATVNSKADYEKLAPGTMFKGSDGKPYRKPAETKPAQPETHVPVSR